MTVFVHFANALIFKKIASFRIRSLVPCSHRFAMASWKPKFKDAILARDREWVCLAAEPGYGKTSYIRTKLGLD
jgi:hypothetical protein